VCVQLGFDICQEIRVELDDEHWYKHVEKLVETSHDGKVTMQRNQKVQTDRTIRNNKPQIIIRENETGACM
jgi:hypothetical protein